MLKAHWFWQLLQAYLSASPRRPRGSRPESSRARSATRETGFQTSPSYQRKRMPFGLGGHASFSKLENPLQALDNRSVKVIQSSVDDALAPVAQKLFWWKTP